MANIRDRRTQCGRWVSHTKTQRTFFCIFLKFDHPIYENDTSPFEKGGNPFDINILD